MDFATTKKLLRKFLKQFATLERNSKIAKELHDEEIQSYRTRLNGLHDKIDVLKKRVEELEDVLNSPKRQK
jgi:phage shock protein A